MEDYLHLDAQLTEEERLVKQSVRRFVDEQVLTLIADAYETGTFPQKLIKPMAELGLLGMTLPLRFGGSEATPIAYGLACQELERGDSALRSFVSVQSSLCMYPIFRYGSTAQKDKYLTKMAQGELIGCFCLTEPDSGSDPASMQTRAEKRGEQWCLNGTKMWITNAPFADLAIVWAKTAEGFAGFIVDTDTPGFTVTPIKHKLSLRVSATGEVALQDCLLSEAQRLPDARGLGAALSCLSQARYGIAWGAMGAAQRCYEVACDYLATRKQFGRPLNSNQLIQKDLADMLTEIVKTQCLNLQIGQLKAQDKATPELISLAKMNGARAALQIARKARNLLGGNGIMLEYEVMRHMNNLETVFTYEGTDNIHHLILGKMITGIAAF